MSAMASQITSVSIVYSTGFFQAQIKENIKAPRHWPLWGTSPVTGEFLAQRVGKAVNHGFNLMTSSFVNVMFIYIYASTQKRKGRQGDCPSRHWWRSLVTTRTVTMTTFRLNGEIIMESDGTFAVCSLIKVLFILKSTLITTTLQI